MFDEGDAYYSSLFFLAGFTLHGPVAGSLVSANRWLRTTGAWSDDQSGQGCQSRLRLVPHFSSRIVERAKREPACKSPHARKGDTRRVAFSRVRWFSRALAFRSLYYPWGTRSICFCEELNGGLLVVYCQTGWITPIHPDKSTPSG